MAESVVYLGDNIDNQGIHPTEEKMKALWEVSRPKKVSEIKFYLGLHTEAPEAPA